ncbi:hypothetical protein FRC07_002148, partial [Ceratobasidium sp. 392]
MLASTIAFILSAALLSSADRSLFLKVTAPGAVVTDVDNLHVLATVSNTGSETLRLLRDPRSPLSQYPTEAFGIVNSSGARAEFTGIKVRYNPEEVAKAGRAGSFVELKPGESVSVEHDLAGVYNLTLTGVGAYTLDAANLFHVVGADGTLTDIYANLQPAKLNVKAPATGTSSKADTLIHEGTHFIQVLGTSDYAYGQARCLSLAESNPTNAIYNA